MLGGSFNSRINLNLREDKGYSYGSRAIFIPTKADGPYMVFAPVQTQSTKESVVEIVKELGYDPIVADNITYLPDQALDDSCYAEAGTCDIFVLIIGGRYGSEVSDGAQHTEKEFYDKYKSITRKEFESALKRDIPIYVAVDRAVMVEYGTWQENRGKTTTRRSSTSARSPVHGAFC